MSEPRKITRSSKALVVRVGASLTRDSLAATFVLPPPVCGFSNAGFLSFVNAVVGEIAFGYRV
jgi:hypothetical protein